MVFASIGLVVNLMWGSSWRVSREEATVNTVALLVLVPLVLILIKRTRTFGLFTLVGYLISPALAIVMLAGICYIQGV